MSAGRIDVRDYDLQGPQVLEFLKCHLERLAGLPAHGNRRLHLDQLLVGLLLAFFNPVVRSLRLIEDCGHMKGRLNIDRLARSTTSDALAVFDPELLRPIIEDLRQRACALRSSDPSLHGITQRIIAGDGTYLSTLADVAWAIQHTKSNGQKQAQVRLNVQMDVADWTPQVLSVSGDDGSEPNAFKPDLLEGVLYVFDRNFLDFSFLKELHSKHSDFVLRARANAPTVQEVCERPLSPQDLAAGVRSDQTVMLTGRHAPEQTLRLVTIEVAGRDGKAQTLRLLSSLLSSEISARIVGEIYRLRWQIELFFKWLKCWAGMNHLLSTTRQGITFQFYVAVIAVLLLHVQTGQRVSRYAISALHNLLHGQITLREMMAVVERREKDKRRERERLAARRAATAQKQPH